MKEGYPAAFDNYGWIMLDRRLGRNDVPAAEQLRSEEGPNWEIVHRWLA